jgi:hypothetical protein
VPALDLSGCDWLGDAGLAHLAGVRRLALRGCGGVSARGLAAAAAGGALEDVALAGCAQLGDDALAAVAGPRLRALDAAGTGAGDAGLCALARAAPALATLSLAHCAQVGDAGVAALARCRGLRRLVLAGCCGFAPAALDALPPALEYLNVHGCSQLAAADVDKLRLRVRVVVAAAAAEEAAAAGAAEAAAVREGGDGSDDDDGGNDDRGGALARDND